MSCLANALIIGRHADSATLDRCFEVVTRTYQALNIEHKVIELPGRRSLHMANTGKIDAELCRIKEITSEFTGLVAIEPHIGTISIVGISLHEFEILSDISSLKGLNIGSRRGIQAVELFFTDFNIHYENNSSALFRLLHEGILDVILVPPLEFENSIPGKELYRVQPNIELNFNLHHFIHKKHISLKDALSQEIEKQLSRLSEKKN